MVQECLAGSIDFAGARHLCASFPPATAQDKFDRDTVRVSFLGVTRAFDGA
jgi:hypothetical protein